MKKTTILLAVIFCFITLYSKAQYTQGDITVLLQPSGTHDSTTCATQGQLIYFITIQNSFAGDSVKVKDMSGILVYEEENISGQNPWYVTAPNISAFGFLPDNQITGGVANFFGPPSKVISGADTIYNIPNFYSVPVPNPCVFGSVTGKIYVDYNGDCIFNGADVPLNAIQTSSAINLNSPTMSYTSASGYSNASGDYNIQVQQSWMTDFNVIIPSQYQFIFPSSACSPASYNFTSLNQDSVDFSLQCTSNLDLNCAVQSSGVVRPNIPFNLFPYVNNLGCTAISGTLKLVLDADVVYDSFSSSNPANSVVGDTLIWNYTNLSNLSNGMYWNSFFGGVLLTPNSNVNIGDTLCFQVFTDVPVGDVDQTNNFATLCLPVVNSYDPNMKEVSPRGIGTQGDIPQSTTDLTYTIHFQNTGTATAYFISVVDTLDSSVLPGSLEILGTSHSMIPQWLGPNIVKFNFYNIMLPDSTTDEPFSHGFVSFKINLNSSLPIGTQIKNKAQIYFDSNPAIVTNITLNTIASLTNIEEKTPSNISVNAYPNPFSEMTTFEINDNKSNETYSFVLIDLLGKQVKSMNNISNKQFQISRAGLSNGIYLYKIYNAKSLINIGKLVIQ